MSFLLTGSLLALTACEKEITVELPDTPERLVVEGTVEPGLPPLVILTRAQGYFEPTNLESLANMFVGDAVVTVTTNGQTWTLPPLCTGSMTPEQIQLAAALTGLDPLLLGAGDICIYTSLDPAHVGVIGDSYALRVEADGMVLTSVTTIPHPVPLDSVWFEPTPITSDNDSIGRLWAVIQDPDTFGNAYRWYDRRISQWPGEEETVYSYESSGFNTFRDRYFNGGTYRFNVGRFAYLGDTILIKFASIGEAEYDFYRTYHDNANSGGDLFGTPTNVRTNITGGLGIWAGWGVYADTLVCE